MKASLKTLIYNLLRFALIRRGNGESVYLTFDDGPQPKNTQRILDVLKKADIKATFFMMGHAMDDHPDIVKQVINEGHALGYHSYQHISLKKRSFNEVREDTRQLKRLAEKFSYPIKLYRPPFGDLTATGLIWYILCGKKIVMWSLDSRDSFDSFEQVKANVSSDRVTPGEIILFHDDYEKTAELLESVVTNYSKENIRCDAL